MVTVGGAWVRLGFSGWSLGEGGRRVTWDNPLFEILDMPLDRRPRRVHLILISSIVQQSATVTLSNITVLIVIWHAYLCH